MPRRMANEEYRNHQWEHRYDTMVAPINHLVDDLCDVGNGLIAPYIAPIYGGIGARLLSVLRDPGPMAHNSGFLSLENDDATAETMCKLLSEVGIDVIDMVPWNAYPWYINRQPNAAELDAGLAPLNQILDLLPKLQVVIIHGGTAQNSWKKFTRLYPNIVAERRLEIIETYHTSRQAFWHRDPAVRESRRQHLRNSLSDAAHILYGKKVVSP